MLFQHYNALLKGSQLKLYDASIIKGCTNVPSLRFEATTCASPDHKRIKPSFHWFELSAGQSRFQFSKHMPLNGVVYHQSIIKHSLSFGSALLSWKANLSHSLQQFNMFLSPARFSIVPYRRTAATLRWWIGSSSTMSVKIICVGTIDTVHSILPKVTS